MALPAEIIEQIVGFQRNEITEARIYRRLAHVVKSPENSKVLDRIAQDEERHYNRWREHTGRDPRPDALKVWFYVLVSRIFGFTFGVKLMERGEEGAQVVYDRVAEYVPEAQEIAREEHQHEEMLLAMLDEERLRYAGSVVLGLNDALVELTGALAGLTLALRDTQLIALTGLITGIAASFSMAASEYLSTKSEDNTKSPLRASLYTGTAYVATVMLLILPYLVLGNYFVCLGCTLVAALGIIAFFNYYISVAKDESFRSRFLEMAGLSMGVAALSFGVGYLLRAWLGVEA